MTTASRPARRALARALAGAILLAVTAVGFAGCGGDGGSSATSAGATARSQAPLEVAAFEAATQRPGTTVLDVRTPAEYAAGHLAGAVDLDVQSPGFADAVARLDPSGSYAVYCHSGNRSAVAVAYLVDHGFSHVVELAGGIAAWQAAGRPVTTG
jgi:rhodanese-related sulfurtransferase